MTFELVSYRNQLISTWITLYVFSANPHPLTPLPPPLPLPFISDLSYKLCTRCERKWHETHWNKCGNMTLWPRCIMDLEGKKMIKMIISNFHPIWRKKIIKISKFADKYEMLLKLWIITVMTLFNQFRFSFDENFEISKVIDILVRSSYVPCCSTPSVLSCCLVLLLMVDSTVHFRCDILR